MVVFKLLVEMMRSRAREREREGERERGNETTLKQMEQMKDNKKGMERKKKREENRRKISIIRKEREIE